VIEKTKSAIKVISIEFTVIFGVELGWNFVAKRSQSVLDSFGISLLTAIGLFLFVNNKRK
jgi:hypothetical protein